jgi:hypothetical protein
MNDKQETLAALKQEFSSWEQLLSQLDDEQITTPLSPSHWSIKDVVAHLRSWQRVSIARLQAALGNHEPVLPAAPAQFDLDTENDVDGINAWTYEQDRDKPWIQVYQEWRDGFLQVLQFGERIPEIDLLDANKYVWLRGYSLLDVLNATYEHHCHDHREPLVAWLQQHRILSDTR